MRGALVFSAINLERRECADAESDGIVLLKVFVVDVVIVVGFAGTWNGGVKTRKDLNRVLPEGSLTFSSSSCAEKSVSEMIRGKCHVLHHLLVQR